MPYAISARGATDPIRSATEFLIVRPPSAGAFRNCLAESKGVVICRVPTGRSRDACLVTFDQAGGQARDDVDRVESLRASVSELVPSLSRLTWQLEREVTKVLAEPGGGGQFGS